MRSFFISKSRLKWRFFLAIIFAIASMIFDKYLVSYTHVRNYLDASLKPLYFLTNLPHQSFKNMSEKFKSYRKLEMQNQELRHEIFLKKADLLSLEEYKKENANYRKLLGLCLEEDEYRIPAHAIFNNGKFSVINRGKSDHVYEGQPVINDEGFIGQVISVGNTSSRVLLLGSELSALPVQIVRNNMRMIMSGGGGIDKQSIKPMYLLKSFDVYVGDILVTSGLDGRFPNGFPVAVVSYVKYDIEHFYSIMYVKPLVSLRNMDNMLLWGTTIVNRKVFSPKEVHDIAIKRFKNMNIVEAKIPHQLQKNNLQTNIYH